ncbi:MAG: OsmC family protein [Nitrososphaerales archaeon]
MTGVVNNINLDKVDESKESFEKEKGHHYIEKKLNGEFQFEGSPSFTSTIQTEMANFVLGADEPSILGGRGIHVSPLTYVLYGIIACYANTLAIQCGLRNIVLKKLNLTGRLFYDIGPMLSNIDSPLINELKIEVDADKDIREIVEISRQKCPALFLVERGIKTSVSQA